MFYLLNYLCVPCSQIEETMLLLFIFCILLLPFPCYAARRCASMSFTLVTCLWTCYNLYFQAYPLILRSIIMEWLNLNRNVECHTNIFCTFSMLSFTNLHCILLDLIIKPSKCLIFIWECFWVQAYKSYFICLLANILCMQLIYDWCIYINGEILGIP